MINFTKNDDNKQFISIRCAADYMLVPLVVIGRHATAANIRYDTEEMVVEIPDGGFNFSLNRMRKLLPEATISTFCVDVNMETQRFYS